MYQPKRVWILLSHRRLHMPASIPAGRDRDVRGVTGHRVSNLQYDSNIPSIRFKAECLQQHRQIMSSRIMKGALWLQS